MRKIASRRSFLAWLVCAAGFVCACGKGEIEAKAPAGEGFLAPPPELTAEALPEPVHAASTPGHPSQAAHEDVHDEQQSAPAPVAEVGIDAQNSPSSSAPVNERELSGALLHQPAADFERLLALRGAGLSETRRALMMAFSAALAGNLQRARELADSASEAPDVTAVEWALLVRALGGDDSQAIAAGAPNGRADAVFGRAAGLALRARDAEEALQAGRYKQAAEAYSDVLLADLEPPWPVDRTALARWTRGLERAQAGNRWSVRGEWPSISLEVQAGDSLVLLRKRAIAEHPQLVVCTGLIERANQLRNELAIHPGDSLRFPTDRVSALIDVSARWMVYLHGDEAVAAWPIGVGRPGQETPVGHYTVGPKQAEPAWFRPGHEPVAFGEAGNPLGTRWLPWFQNGVKTGFGFHGTNDDAGIGGRVSQGCVRMINADVELLYEILPQDSRVVVQP